MTTQAKLNDSIEGAQAPVIKQHFSLPLALAILLLGVLLGVFATTLTTASMEIGGQPVAEQVAPTYSRGPTLAEYVAAIEENGVNAQRAIAAETARYNGLVEFYGTERGSERAIAAEAARYNGLTLYHQSEWGNATIEVSVPQHDREYGLARFDPVEIETHTLAWPPRPMQFHPIEKSGMTFDENALATYHQSEWGLASNKAEADRDIGLMEFSSTGK